MIQFPCKIIAVYPIASLKDAYFQLSSRKLVVCYFLVSGGGLNSAVVLECFT